MKRRGGFRTRWRVVYARAAWGVARSLRAVLSDKVRDEFWLTVRWRTKRDYQRCCPHPPEERRASIAGYIDCALCEACLRTPGRWNVWPVVAPDACACQLELRRRLWYESRGKPRVEVAFAEHGFRPQVPDHRPECPVVWMDAASEPHAVAV